MDRVTLFVRISDMPDALRLGWIPTPALRGTVHGFFSVLCIWIPCACGRPAPKPAGAA